MTFVELGRVIQSLYPGKNLLLIQQGLRQLLAEAGEKTTLDARSLTTFDHITEASALVIFDTFEERSENDGEYKDQRTIAGLLNIALSCYVIATNLDLQIDYASLPITAEEAQHIAYTKGIMQYVVNTEAFKKPCQDLVQYLVRAIEAVTSKIQNNEVMAQEINIETVSKEGRLIS